MEKVMGKLQEMILASDYVSTCLYACLAMVLIVIVVHFLTRQLRLIKYVPGFLAMGYGTSYVLNHLDAFLEVDKVDQMVYYLIAVGAGLIGLLMALILGILAKEKKVKVKKPRKAKKNKEEKKTQTKKSTS